MGWFRTASVQFMFLSVKEMEVRKIRFDEAFRAGQIDFAGDELEQDSLLRAAGEAALVPHTAGEVRIQGRFSVEMAAACDRCLERTRYPLEAGFDLYYRPAETIAREEEVGIDEAESEIGFYTGDGIELEDVLREQVLLALPMQRICREDCKGICPACGQNRNHAACNCKMEDAAGRWGALQKLKIPQ
jgi:uncharacterized protein